MVLGAKKLVRETVDACLQAVVRELDVAVRGESRRKKKGSQKIGGDRRPGEVASQFAVPFPVAWECDGEQS